VKAVVVTNTSEYGIENVELESPKANEIKVRLEAAGLCHSDLSLINGTVQGPLPLVLGHEGAGIVTEVGPATTRFRVGDHVVFTAQTDIPMLLDFHHQGRLDLDRMVSKIYAIDEIHQAFIDMQENVNAKGVIVFAQ